MTITAQVPGLFPDDGPKPPDSPAAQFLSPDGTITAQADLAVPPGAPGFGGQGWSTHETMLVVKWLLSDPAAWDRAMDVARRYPGNPHAVADTLHEQVVPRTVLEAIAAQGLDPARVNWLEIAHELIERRNDPRPDPAAAVTMAGDAADEDTIPAAVGAPVPDDPTAISMFTAHRLDDTLHELAHATERMTAARAAPAGGLRAYHSARVFQHLQAALDGCHDLTANIRAHYPEEARELEQVKQAVGLARSLTPEVKAATTAHLLETTLHEETHGVRHAEAMSDTEPDDVWSFNADHCSKHLAGAVEHAGKLAQHFRDNYPDVARWLDGLDEITSPAEEGGDGKQQQQHARYAKGDGTASAQLANWGYELNPRSAMISLDLPPGLITPVPGGVADFHITVVYLGPDVDDEAFAQACDRAQKAAAAMPGPLTGTVGGIGTFPPSGGSDGKVPVWAGVILPGAERLRSALEDLSASEHPDWKPHVTVAYTDAGDPLPAPVPPMQVSFTHLSVHRGDDEVARYPLGGDPGQTGPATISAQAS